MAEHHLVVRQALHADEGAFGCADGNQGGRLESQQLIEQPPLHALQVLQIPALPGVQIDDALHAGQVGIQVGRDIADHLMGKLVGQFADGMLHVSERQPAYQSARRQHRHDERQNEKGSESRLHSNPLKIRGFIIH